MGILGMSHRDNDPSSGTVLPYLGANETYPTGFPLTLWSEMSQKYAQLERYFSGEIFGETQEEKGLVKKYFPLSIPVARTVCRKHQSILLGAATRDEYELYIRPVVKPKGNIEETPSTTEEVKEANAFQNLLLDIWENSNGRDIQAENALLVHIFGGCVFKVAWKPEREDLELPIVFERIMPDFFLPVWENNNYWSLNECYVVYRTQRLIVEKSFNVEFSGAGGDLVTVVEHWTKTTHSLYVNGEPVTVEYKDKYSEFTHKITYDSNNPNPFGFVPYVYIPHLREGSFYGMSPIDDIFGLLREYNWSVANAGDVLRNYAKRNRFGTDISPEARGRVIDKKLHVYDLGETDHVSKATPKIMTEDIPSISAEIAGVPENVWRQILRDACLSPILFGEDEGTQRTGEALNVMMLPATMHSDIERAYWTTGLNILSKMVIRMMRAKLNNRRIAKYVNKNHITRERLDFWEQECTITHRYRPAIMRERDLLVNEVVLKRQAGLVSLRLALQQLGDTDDIEGLLEEINKEIEENAKMLDIGEAKVEKPEATGNKSDMET